MCQGTARNDGWSARESEPTSRRHGSLERQGEAALPGDVVLRLVEAVPVEVVHEVPALGADADLAEAILEPSAEIAGELGPGVGGVELMHADRADAARADADVVGEPAGRIERRRPPESPIGRADVVQIGGARQTAERAAKGKAATRGTAAHGSDVRPLLRRDRSETEGREARQD